MNDIFISYARDDRKSASALAQALETQGWSVWSDRDIPSGRAWSEVIETALRSARCVVVMWSAQSVKSAWVKEEAELAKALGKLMPVLIERVEPPFGFRHVQAVELFEWNGAEAFPGFQKLASDIRALLSLNDAARRIGGLPDVAMASRADGRVSPAHESTNAEQITAIAVAARAALGKPAGEPMTEQDWLQVTELELAYTDLGDSGLRYIGERTSPVYLDLAGNRISDAGLQYVARLSNLTYLDLSSNPDVTDAGLVHLRPNRRLTHLNLSGTSVTAGGLLHLAGLPSLSELVLRGTPITVRGIESLAGYTALAKLDLGRTALADDVVPYLERLSHLEFLGLRDTQISGTGKEQVKRALLRCRVIA